MWFFLKKFFPLTVFCIKQLKSQLADVLVKKPPTKPLLGHKNMTKKKKKISATNKY